MLIHSIHTYGAVSKVMTMMCSRYGTVQYNAIHTVLRLKPPRSHVAIHTGLYKEIWIDIQR